MGWRTQHRWRWRTRAHASGWQTSFPPKWDTARETKALLKQDAARETKALLKQDAARETKALLKQDAACETKALPQRGIALQPRVARNELPWESVVRIGQPRRGCGGGFVQRGRNRVAVGMNDDLDPR